MTVLVCNDVPPAVRGAFKRWFIEPRPNVFVGTLNVRNHRKVMDFILRNAPPEFGMLVISSAPNCQGYAVERFGPQGKTGRKEIEISRDDALYIKKAQETQKARKSPELGHPRGD